MTPDQELDNELTQLGAATRPASSVVDQVMCRIAAEAASPVDQHPVRPDAHVPTEWADDVSREAHPIEQPPHRRHVRRFIAMFQRKAVRWVSVAAVAAAVVLAVGFWPGKSTKGPGSVFAAAIQQFQKANSIMCQFSSPSSINIMGMKVQASGKWYMSAQHGTRFETYGSGILCNYMITPIEGPCFSVMPLCRSYMVVDLDQPGDRRSSPDSFIRSLSSLTSKPDRELGMTNIDGVNAYGYEISGKSLGYGDTPGARSELWVDPQTQMPVRYVVEMPGFEEGKIMTCIFDQFEYDVSLDPKLFDTTMPPEFKRIDAKMPVQDETCLVNALRLYSKCTGNYPSALSMPTVVGGLMMAGLKGAKQPTEQESVEIGTGVVYYMQLAGKGGTPEYHGQTVKPGQADAILVRWKAEDGSWRVIYGDLHIETSPK